MARDLYDVLGVSKTPTEDEIKKAFPKLAAKPHPDRNPGQANEDPLKEGNRAIHARHATFSVDSTSYPVPTLVMDPDGATAGAGGALPAEPLAEGIEDMQIAVGIDSDGTTGLSEGPSTTDEWFYNTSGDATVATTATVRAIRITLVARTTSALFGNATTFFNRPAAEDRAAGVTDNFRRRLLTTTIELRNVSGSP